MTDGSRIAYVIAFSAPPVLELHEFLVLLPARDWDPYVILSPTAATWADVEHLAHVSGHPFVSNRVGHTMPIHSRPLT